MQRGPWGLAAGVLAALLAAAACGKGKTSPATPSTPVLPLPSTSPAPRATSELPLSASCAKLPNGVPNASCGDDTPDFKGDVTTAILTLQSERPEIFDPTDGTVVRNVGAYYVGLIKTLDRRAICAGFDGEELTVKTSNDYSEQYKVLTSRNQVNDKYIGTCAPAIFPLAQGALPPPPAGCSLPASREVACGNPASQFEGFMQSAIAQVLKDRPELFDYTDLSPATRWPRVTNFDAYYAAVIGVLAKQGFCGRFDGEEMVIKKTNEFSEHFKINLSDRWVRMGDGIYRSACYPAAF